MKDGLISKQEAIEALSICDNKYGINCHKCPLRDERWDGAWIDYDNEIACYQKLMLDSAKLLADAVPVVRCGECKHMTADGRCLEFADDCLRHSASDFCSRGERKSDE